MLPMSNPEPRSDFAAGGASAWPAQVPLRQALFAQLSAGLLVLMLGPLFPAATVLGGNAMTMAWLQGVVAAALGRGLGMDSWWLPIHVLFVPGLVWTLAFGLSPWYAASVFGLLASIFWGLSQTRVPLFLSNHATTLAMTDLLPREHSFSFLDLGCGLGGVLTSLARVRPSGRYHGIESAPLPFLISWLRAAFGSQSCRIRWGDFSSLDLGHYDVVYAYLSPAAMGDVWRKAKREMRAGSLLISNSFPVLGVPPTLTVSTGTQTGSRLLLWRM